MHDVVLDPMVAGLLAHEAIGHTCEADNVLSGSIAADWLGQPVAAEKVTLGDYGGRGPDGKSDLATTLEARRGEVETRLTELQATGDMARAWAQLSFLLPVMPTEEHP